MPIGVYEHKSRDITGLKFGRLTAIEFSHKNEFGMHHWVTRCDCGKIKTIRKQHLELGLSRSCSCLNKEIVVERQTVHGMCNTRFYHIWENMKNRTSQVSHKSWHRYGGRGITVCGRWQIFENFRDDMYESYLKHVEEFGVENTTIDRRNNDGNYEPLNCRWATRKEQQNNRQPFKDIQKVKFPVIF